MELHGEAQLQHQAPALAHHVKSAYEQQQEQQRLVAQRAEEHKQVLLRQEALQAQRDKVLKEREQRLKEEQQREEQQHKEADRREQLLREEHHRLDMNSDSKSPKKPSAQLLMNSKIKKNKHDGFQLYIHRFKRSKITLRK